MPRPSDRHALPVIAAVCVALSEPVAFEIELLDPNGKKVATAQRAGVRSILVKTGKGGLDHRLAATPDHTFADLSAAVDFQKFTPRSLFQTAALVSSLSGMGR